METRVCNKCQVEKDLLDFPVQKNCTGGRRPTCKKCMAAKTAAWRAQDPSRNRKCQEAVKARNPARWYEKERVRTNRYKANNKEKVREAYARYYREGGRDVCAKWYSVNRDAVKERVKKWAADNPDKVRKYSLVSANKRRAIKVLAMPKWADKAEIEWIYEKRTEITKMTGIEYHVDHIVPLRGETVCGLHVADNLQIIEASVNLSKGNRFNHG